MAKNGIKSSPRKLKENKFEEIYDVVKLIPKGKVSSYGVIAAYLGSKGGARIVGWAMNAIHHRPDVPAHRVVNRIGLLSGKNAFDTPTTMQQKLEAEGLKIENDKIQDFDRHFWNPNTELL